MNHEGHEDDNQGNGNGNGNGGHEDNSHHVVTLVSHTVAKAPVRAGQSRMFGG